MFTETQKLSLIEAIIKSSDDSMLRAIELIVNKGEATGGEGRAPSKFSDLLGVLTGAEAEAMNKTIHENFETINGDDWK